MKDRLFVKDCQVLLSTSYKDFGIWELIVNYVDAELFGNCITKLSTEVYDRDLINNIKCGSIEDTKKAIIMVLNDNCKYCKEIKHEFKDTHVKYYFEVKLEKSIKNIINELMV